jgi:hypothetical protein
MSKAKTNALDALRALIAERQQYEQWISTLEAKREGTPEHVFERVHNDYRGRLDRVLGEIRGHAEELQLSISTLSARLVEVAREEDSRREGLQEAELRAAVGEYERGQWEEIKSEAESALEKIAADRVSLDSQLSELRAIQKLAEMGPGMTAEPQEMPASPVVADKAVEAPTPSVEPAPSAAEPARAASGGHRSGTAAEPPRSEPARAEAPRPEPSRPEPSRPEPSRCSVGGRERYLQAAIDEVAHGWNPGGSGPHRRESSGQSENSQVPGMRDSQLSDRMVLRALRW